MKIKRIKRFGIYQTSKVSAAVYFVLTMIILLPFGLIASLFGNSLGFPLGGFIFILPFVYGFVGFIVTALCCAIYNWIVRYTGGIEMEVETGEYAAGNDLQSEN